MAAELTSPDRVLYFYGVTQCVPPDPVRSPGVDPGSKLEAIECDGFVCWISRVPATEFETNLASNMENLDWLARASVAHQQAVGAIAQQTEIIPARFGTVFSTRQSLIRHIRERAGDLKKDFHRIQDADEWGIKVFASQKSATPIPAVKSGKDYLKAKAALLPRKDLARDGNNFEDFENALQKVALESSPAGKVSSGQRGLRFQTSLLVKRADRRKLQSVLKKFSQLWAESRQIECTGPWAPYSFVSRHNVEST